MLLWQWLRILISLILSWRSPSSYRNQSTDLLCKSMNWFLYDSGLRDEKVHQVHSAFALKLWQFHWNCLNYKKSHALTVVRPLRYCTHQGLKRISFYFKAFHVSMKKCVYYARCTRENMRWSVTEGRHILKEIW